MLDFLMKMYDLQKMRGMYFKEALNKKLCSSCESCAKCEEKAAKDETKMKRKEKTDSCIDFLNRQMFVSMFSARKGVEIC
jgi:hypothetical protein